MAQGPTFSTRLCACMKRADMTISDLSRWFARPRPTVNTWVNGRAPYGPSGRQAIKDLELLEKAVRNNVGFPVPENLTWKNRAEYIRGIRNAAQRNPRLPPMRAAG